MVRGSMGQKMSLVCFREGSDEIIGANILLVLTKQGQDSGMQQARQIVWMGQQACLHSVGFGIRNMYM